VLFGGIQPQFSPPTAVVPHNRGLNEPQLEAIALCLSAQDLACIHGPPGTGKTTTVCELIWQAVKRGERVLACAPSNVAVDNMVERLHAAKLNVVRLGHPARLLPSVVRRSMDVLLYETDSAALARDVRRELEQLRTTKSRDGRSARREELRLLRKELRLRERAAIVEVISGAQVVLCTNTGAADKALDLVEAFDMVVIDEAAQALEVSCWIPILRGRKLVLAGDHRQLTPTVVSDAAAKKGLSRTLFERTQDLYGDLCTRMLTLQYRMHTNIMHVSSQALYDGQLQAAESVAGHTLGDMPGVTDADTTRAALVVIDTAGCDLDETSDASGSHANVGEVEVVVRHLATLLEAGVKAEQIGVITPYNAQLQLLKRRIKTAHPALELGTVDGFQGREKEAIVISLVRSNPEHQVGFVADQRRTNVAVTRARRHVAIVCDSETLGRDPFVGAVLKHCEETGMYLSAASLIDAPEPTSFPPAEEVSMALPITAAALRKEPDARRKDAKAKAPQKPSTGKSGAEQKKSATQGGQAPLSKPVHSEAEEQAEEGEMQRTLQQFLDSGRDTMDLRGLSSFQRMIAHQLCERFNLLHVSRGEGDDRVLTVSRPSKPTNPWLAKSASTQPEPTEEPEEEGEAGEPARGGAVGFACLEDEGTAVVEIGDETEAQEEATEGSASQKKNKKKKKKKKPQNPAAAAAAACADVDEDDLDTLLASVRRGVDLCFVPTCKQNVKLMGRVCQHCKMKLCFEHALPEVHGCGDAAKKQAREQFVQSISVGKERERLKNMGRSGKPLNREELKRSLHAKARPPIS